MPDGYPDSVQPSNAAGLWTRGASCAPVGWLWEVSGCSDDWIAWGETGKAPPGAMRERRTKVLGDKQRAQLYGMGWEEQELLWEEPGFVTMEKEEHVSHL